MPLPNHTRTVKMPVLFVGHGSPMNAIQSNAFTHALEKLGREEKEWLGETGAVALPEFGTANTRRMLEMTKPKTFTDLIYISGLSHGTGVWAGNAEKLIAEKTATLDTVISTRDDIMNRLIQQGMTPVAAYDITEHLIQLGAWDRCPFLTDRVSPGFSHGQPASCVLRAITITAGLLGSGFSSRCGTYGGTKM